MFGVVRGRRRARRRVAILALTASVTAIALLSLGLSLSAAAPSQPAKSNVPYSFPVQLPAPASSPTVDAAAPYTPAVLSLIAQLEPSKNPTQAELSAAGALLHDQASPACHNIGPVPAPIGTTPSIQQICWADAQGVLNTSGNNARGSTAPTTLMALGSTFDRALGNVWGQTEGTESREFMVTGMFGPQTDLDRLPNWVRNLTTTGEDPFLSNQLVSQQINGMQGSGTMSQMKHFVAFNGQNQNAETDIGDQGLHELYLTPYEGGFTDGRAAATMCSYQIFKDTSTSLPGALSSLSQTSPFSAEAALPTWPLNEAHFSCEQPLALNYVLRKMWGSKAFVGTDYPAGHSVAGILQGMDQEMPTKTGLFSDVATAQGVDPTGDTCADDKGTSEPCSTPNALHVAGIPNNYNGAGNAGCPTSGTPVSGGGCALVQAVVTGNLPVSLFNQSLARILYQEERFGMLGCNDTPVAATCKNPGGVGSDRSGTATLPTGAQGKLGTQVGDAAIVEKMSEEGSTLLKNDGGILPIKKADLAGGILVTGASANHLVADPTKEASTGFVGRDAINPLQQLKSFSGSPDAFTFAPANDPNGTAVSPATLSSTADESGLGGLSLSIDGGPAKQDTTALDHEQVNGNQLAPGHTYTWSGSINVPKADTYTFALQQSATLPTTLDCPQTGELGTPVSDPTLTLCNPFTAANAADTSAQPDAVTLTLDGKQLNLNALTAPAYAGLLSTPSPSGPVVIQSSPTTAGALDQGLISRTCATGTAALEPGTTNCDTTQSALTPGFHKLQITVDNAKNCVATPAAAATATTPAVAAVPAPCVPASFRFAATRVDGDIADAAAAAKGKKLALVFVNDGTDPSQIAPNPLVPGTTISAVTQLSSASTKLIEAVSAVNPNTVVVMNTENPVLLPWLPHVKGVLESWFAGQEGGTAMARVLLGLANPSGHTPITWPVHATDTIWGYDETTPLYPGDTTGQHLDRLNGNGGCAVIAGSNATCPPAGNTNESEGIYAGYRFFDKEGIAPQFPFGYGLSYASFAYSGMQMQPAHDGGLDVAFTVRNTGKVAGADAAQVYVGPPSHQPAGIQFAVRSLAQFERVELQPGQARRVTLHVPRRQLSYWSDAAQQWVLDAGGRKVWVGDADAPAQLPLSATVYESHSVHSCVNEQLDAMTIDGNLHVPRGAWCDLVDVKVTGSVHAERSSGIRIQSSAVAGNVRISRTSGASDPLSAGANTVCDSTIGGDLDVHRSRHGVAWTIGGCGPNTIHGRTRVDRR